MPSESVSFRITRTAEDLAQTVSALSQRLVRLEQRLGALELQTRVEDQADPREMDALETVERLLHDCRTLLDSTEPVAEDSNLGQTRVQETPYHQAA